MAGNPDEELESILSDFDQIHSNYREGIGAFNSGIELQYRRFRSRESIQFTTNTLKSENERLMKLYTEPSAKNWLSGGIDWLLESVNGLKVGTSCRSLKEN
ncbi:hypothetical protein CTI12_AA176340 [Artemisia annua]|uniref:Uncharacterized protein n=1 Tax=Artemisia annua TaxID=35608 RepID=A0A2U1NSZ1_ARTAN|nr:hypothetical protein CTI12_AA176340 [Artemisia annua]